jgi:predicted nucleotidyltransferase
MTKEYILNYLREHKSEFREKFGVTKIALFGSYARDEQRGDSDIDISIEVVKSSFRNRLKLQYFLEEYFNKKIDLGYFNTFRASIKREVEKEMIYV